MIFEVFKRKRRRKGKLVKARTYTGRYRLEDDFGRPTEVALRVTDKRVAENKLREIVEAAERERAGIGLPKKLVEAAAKRMRAHLDDFIADLKAKGRTKVYIYDVNYRIGTLIEECGWEYPKDVTGDSYIRWRTCDHEKSAKTLNDYFGAIRNLLRWMQSRGRIASNPLAGIELVDGRGKEKINRRPLTEAEFRRLWTVAGRRRGLYLMAVLTALRRKALYRLEWGDVHLDAPHPFIEVRVITEKNRKPTVKWLRDDLVAELGRIRPVDVAPNKRVFEGILPSRGLDFLKNDLAAADIEFIDAQERRIDFHALRHTACTWAGATGASGPVLQTFTGHSDSKQVARYTHDQYLPTKDVVDRLPRFDDTDDRSGHELATGTLSEHGTQIGTQNGDAGGHMLSRSVNIPLQDEETQVLVNTEESHELAHSVTSCQEGDKTGRYRTRTCDLTGVIRTL